MKALALCCFFQLCVSIPVFADAGLPKNCQPLKVIGESVTVHAKKTKLVLIHNKTSADLWITHPATNPGAGASAGWTTRLQTNHWSALVVKKDAFVLNCIESKPGHEQQIPCEEAIAVCQWKGVKFPDEAHGTFWAGEDMSLSALDAAIGARGFILRH